MARPAKPNGISKRHDTKADIETRKAAETAIVPKAGEPIPTHELTESQQALWDSIVEYYSESGILAPLDGMTLTPYVVSLDAVRQIDLMINQNPQLLDSSLVSKRKVYMTEVWRGGQEFCLSPQARAKIGSLAVEKERAKKDELEEALND